MKSYNEKLKIEIKNIQSKIKNIKFLDDIDKIKYKIRAEYITNGHINDPKKGYHLEYNYDKYEQANKLLVLLSYVGIDTRLCVRDKKYIVYVKNKNTILKFLDIIGSIKIKKDYKFFVNNKTKKQNVSRHINFEIANMKKVVNANYKQLDDINILLSKYDYDSLDDNLKIVIDARRLNPTATLSELSDKIGNITKSTINHRFNKIREMIK